MRGYTTQRYNSWATTWRVTHTRGGHAGWLHLERASWFIVASPETLEPLAGPFPEREDALRWLRRHLLTPR